MSLPQVAVEEDVRGFLASQGLDVSHRKNSVGRNPFLSRRRLEPFSVKGHHLPGRSGGGVAAILAAILAASPLIGAGRIANLLVK
jgi:hypothetical protein